MSSSSTEGNVRRLSSGIQQNARRPPIDPFRGHRNPDSASTAPQMSFQRRLESKPQFRTLPLQEDRDSPKSTPGSSTQPRLYYSQAERMRTGDRNESIALASMTSAEPVISSGSKRPRPGQSNIVGLGSPRSAATEDLVSIRAGRLDNDLKPGPVPRIRDERVRSAVAVRRDQSQTAAKEPWWSVNNHEPLASSPSEIPLSHPKPRIKGRETPISSRDTHPATTTQMTLLAGGAIDLPLRQILASATPIGNPMPRGPHVGLLSCKKGEAGGTSQVPEYDPRLLARPSRDLKQSALRSSIPAASFGVQNFANSDPGSGVTISDRVYDQDSGPTVPDRIQPRRSTSTISEISPPIQDPRLTEKKRKYSIADRARALRLFDSGLTPKQVTAAMQDIDAHYVTVASWRRKRAAGLMDSEGRTILRKKGDY